jgi:hypothetical protein
MCVRVLSMVWTASLLDPIEGRRTRAGRMSGEGGARQEVADHPGTSALLPLPLESHPAQE